MTGADIFARYVPPIEKLNGMLTTLARVDEVQGLSGDYRLVDCRFSLMQPQLGAELFAESHIPGAVYAHLDDDLSGDIIFGHSGRHPLPDRDVFANTLTRWGIGNTTQVIAYDDSGGPFAARLWWLLRWMGHRSVAVLDGGFTAWRDSGSFLIGETVAPNTVKFVSRDPLNLTVGTQDILDNDSWLLIDAREGARYRGDAEPIDPVAGRIPGALNVPFQQNLGDDGFFKSVDDLAALYKNPIGDKVIDTVVCYCGSGVTAAHTVLATTHAGLGTPKLYAGSWSEWITDPERPVERG
jgi:thiosulfate/3-mercaptopyruvate sulfurtransferase